MIQTLRMLLSFRGRIVRLRYWVTTLVALLMIVLASLLAIWASRLQPLVDPVAVGIFIVLMLLALAVFLLMIWLVASVLVRRLHDRNWSGWWAIPVFLASLVPDLLARMDGVSLGVELPLLLVSAIIGFWSLVELGFLRGTRGENRFGPDPLQQGKDLAEAFD